MVSNMLHFTRYATYSQTYCLSFLSSEYLLLIIFNYYNSLVARARAREHRPKGKSLNVKLNLQWELVRTPRNSIDKPNVLCARLIVINGKTLRKEVKELRKRKLLANASCKLEERKNATRKNFANCK